MTRRIGQSRRMSAIETALNIIVGFALNFCLNLLVLPLFGFDVTVAQNLGIGAIFTVAAVLRGYGMRRLFNWLHVRAGEEPS